MRLARAPSRTYALIVLACSLPRLLYAALRPPDPSWGAHYWPMSSSLLEHGVLGHDGAPSTMYEPLYPAFLAAARYLVADDLFLVLVLQTAVCSIGAIYLYELSRVLTEDSRTAAIAAGIYCAYPYFIRQAAALEEVPLFTTLLIASAYYYVTAEDGLHAAACGVAFGLTLLTRVVAAPIWALGVVALAVRRHFSSALAVTVVAVLFYAPYALRNHRIDGSILPTRGGFNLLKTNCKYTDQVIPDFMYDVLNGYVVDVAEKEMADRSHATERELDRFYFWEAARFIRSQPSRAIAGWARNAAYLFYPRLVPFHPIGPGTVSRFTGDEKITVENPGARSVAEELSYTISYTPVLLAALVGIYFRRKQWERDLILYLTMVCFVVTYSLSFPATRTRAPMDFVLMFYAAVATRRGLRVLGLPWEGSAH